MQQNHVHFTCNICGKSTKSPKLNLHREMGFCEYCHSNMRFRNVICSLFLALGLDGILNTKSKQKHVTGLGLSDNDIYAKYLNKLFSYKNTFFHKEPKLDITSIPDNMESNYDFVISSDVFEHVMPPIDKVFSNCFDLLKKNGWLIMTVPHYDSNHIEHYPNINKYQIIDFNNSKLVINKTKNNQFEIFENPVFHGGGGETLEMRIFGRQHLLQLLKESGFVNVQFITEDFPTYGVIHPMIDGNQIIDGVPIIAQKP